MPPPLQPPPIATVPPPAPSSLPTNGNTADDQATPIKSSKRKKSKEPVLRYLDGKFSEKTFQTVDTHTYLCLSGGNKW